jgi:hypothetical protein
MRPTVRCLLTPCKLDYEMHRWPAVIGLALLWPLASAAVGSDFEIRASVKSEGRETHALRTEESPGRGGKESRPVAELERGKTVVLTWHAESKDKSETYEDVLLHFFVVEEKRIGQSQVPKLSAGVIYEGAATMDFRPRDAADWQASFKIPEAGNYLLRVETIGMAARHGHEHFAAMDLRVK